MTTLTLPTLQELPAARLKLSGSVSVRPERFGALLYDFRTRKLLFLKTPSLAEVVTQMDGTHTTEQCLDSHQVEDSARPGLLAVVHHLLNVGMLKPAAPTTNCEDPS